MVSPEVEAAREAVCPVAAEKAPGEAEECWAAAACAVSPRGVPPGSWRPRLWGDWGPQAPAPAPLGAALRLRSPAVGSCEGVWHWLSPGQGVSGTMCVVGLVFLRRGSVVVACQQQRQQDGNLHGIFLHGLTPTLVVQTAP